jgi:hypothetical protein
MGLEKAKQNAALRRLHNFGAAATEKATRQKLCAFGGEDVEDLSNRRGDVILPLVRLGSGRS